MNSDGKIYGKPYIPVRPCSDPTRVTERRGQRIFGDRTARCNVSDLSCSEFSKPKIAIRPGNDLKWTAVGSRNCIFVDCDRQRCTTRLSTITVAESSDFNDHNVCCFIYFYHDILAMILRAKVMRACRTSTKQTYLG